MITSTTKHTNVILIMLGERGYRIDYRVQDDRWDTKLGSFRTEKEAMDACLHHLQVVRALELGA